MACSVSRQSPLTAFCHLRTVQPPATLNPVLPLYYPCTPTVLLLLAAMTSVPAVPLRAADGGTLQAWHSTVCVLLRFSLWVYRWVPLRSFTFRGLKPSCLDVHGVVRTAYTVSVFCGVAFELELAWWSSTVWVHGRVDGTSFLYIGG